MDRGRGDGRLAPHFRTGLRSHLPPRVWAVPFLLALLVLPGVPSVSGDLAIQWATRHAVAGAPSWAPMSAVTVNAGAGACLSSESTTLPFGAGSDRANIAIVEPRGCPSATRLTFLPSERFTSAILVPASHVLTVRVDLLAMNGSTTMLRNVHVYEQQVGLVNPIVTGTHVQVRNGAITRPSTSTATVVAATTYGIGVRMTLNHLAASGHATLQLLVVTTLNDGGVPRAIEFEWVSLLLIY